MHLLIRAAMLVGIVLPAARLGAFELADIVIAQSDVRKFEILKDREGDWIDGCKISDKGKPFTLNIQPALLYEKPELYEQLMGKVQKGFVNITCGEKTSSIIYLKFSNPDSAKSSLGFLKGLLWGEKGPTRLHPERLLRFGNIVVVISSPKEGIADYLLMGKVIYANIPGEILKTMQKSHGCDSDNQPEFCESLAQIARYRSNFSAQNFSGFLFGKVWYLTPGKPPEQRFSFAKIEKDQIGIRDLKPDDDKELQILQEIISGKITPPPDLIQFVSAAPLEFKVLEKYAGSLRATHAGNVFSFYPVGKRIFFVVSADHITNEPGMAIVGYYVKP